MTPIEDVYTMSADTIMNEENIQHVSPPFPSLLPLSFPSRSPLPPARLALVTLACLALIRSADAPPAPRLLQLVQSGYSRVPVHEPGKPDAILGMLLCVSLGADLPLRAC